MALFYHAFIERFDTINAGLRYRTKVNLNRPDLVRSVASGAPRVLAGPIRSVSIASGKPANRRSDINICVAGDRQLRFAVN
jgi:hypothetical protein